MDAKFSPKTFEKDHIIRDETGKPLGRLVMRNDEDYEEGQDIQVAVLKVPVAFKETILGSEVYVDGYRYKIPDEIPKFRVNQRTNDWVASSFLLCRSGNHKQDK
jgi:hypothetical protein